jgi:hypothetical protein
LHQINAKKIKFSPENLAALLIPVEVVRGVSDSHYQTTWQVSKRSINQSAASGDLSRT